MTTVYDCTDPEQLLEGSRHAQEALNRGELIIMPTDTVYGIAADPFHPVAQRLLREAKGTTWQSPPAVLIPDTVTINRLAKRVQGAVYQLTPRFWPGALTIVLRAQPGLVWNAGEDADSVALRMPDNDVALALLHAAGPLAVSGANPVGRRAATTAGEAAELFADVVSVVLDGGQAAMPDAGLATLSTIVDATTAVESGVYRVLRQGSIGIEQLRIVLGDEAVVDVTTFDEPVDAEDEVVSAVEALD